MGRFFVSKRILLTDELYGRAIFDGLVILEAHYRYDRDGTDYLATGEVFDEIPEGEEAPRYEVTINEAGKVEFQRYQTTVVEHLAAHRVDDGGCGSADL